MVNGASARVWIAISLSLAMHNLHAQLAAPSSAPSLSQDSPAPETPMLQVHIQEVLIPVVVRDAEGRAMGDLKQSDFKVFDQGKPRKIAGFGVQRSPASAVSALGSAGGASKLDSAANGAAISGGQQGAGAQRTITFLFDDRHLGIAELEQVKSAAMRMLDAPLADSERGLVLSFLGVNSGLTHSHAVLQAAVAKLKVNQAFRPGQNRCPGIDYYAADQILNKHNDAEFKIAIEKASACNHNSNMELMRQLVETDAMEALQAGDQDVRETLVYLRDVVHTISAFPGQRTLVLVSPGFLSGSTDALALQSQILDLAASAHVSISALDARGLFSGQVAASQGGSNSVTAEMTGEAQQDDLEAMRENEDIMAALADGAAGSFIHNSNDLQAGLERLVAGPEFLYTLDLSLPDVKANGTYHALKVEVNRKDAKVQARRGYFAPFPARK
jgi:VWFA-related protein